MCKTKVETNIYYNKISKRKHKKKKNKAIKQYHISYWC